MFLLDLFQDIKSNSWLSIIFYLGIAVLIGTCVFYIYLTRRYNKLSKFLSELEEKDVHKRIERINDFIKGLKLPFPKVLKRSWHQFYNEHINDTNETIPDPLFYFNDKDIINKSGYRKLVEVIPSVFVSLGILGTFLGITSGLTDIDTNSGSEGLQTGINSLLDGMSFAFYSSILGIIISLAYQLIDRIVFYKMLTRNMDKLLLELDKAIPIETESNLLEKMAKAQENQLSEMQTFFTDQFMPMLTSGISDSMADAVKPQLQKSNEIMEQVAQNTLEAQSESLNQMVDQFVESLNEVTGNHIKNLGDALQSTVEWQEKVHGEMSNLVKELSNVAKEQSDMAQNTMMLSEQMNEHTDKLYHYQEQLINTTHDMESITKENSELLNQMGETYEKITQKQQEDNELFDQRIENMNESVDKIANLGTTFTELTTEMKFSLESLVDSTESVKGNITENQKLTDSLIKQHELSNDWSVETQKLLEDVHQNSDFVESIQNNLQNLYEVVNKERDALNNMQSDYGETLTNSVQELSQLWDENSNVLHSAQGKFTDINDSLSHSMDNFAEHMQRGVQRTFEQFDAELKKAVEYLERGVSNVGNVVESMEEDMGNVNGQITRFNDYLEQFNEKAENRMVTHE